jgi:hypothetical protein
MRAHSGHEPGPGTPSGDLGPLLRCPRPRLPVPGPRSLPGSGRKSRHPDETNHMPGTTRRRGPGTPSGDRGPVMWCPWSRLPVPGPRQPPGTGPPARTIRSCPQRSKSRHPDETNHLPGTTSRRGPGTPSGDLGPLLRCPRPRLPVPGADNLPAAAPKSRHPDETNHMPGTTRRRGPGVGARNACGPGVGARNT